MLDRIDAAQNAVRAIANVIDLATQPNMRKAAIEAQQNIAALQQENIDLQKIAIDEQQKRMKIEAELERLKTHIQTQENFEIVETHPGSLIVRSRGHKASDGPEIPFCHPCFERGERSALSFDRGDGMLYQRRCQTCGAIAVFQGPEYANRARPGDHPPNWDPLD